MPDILDHKINGYLTKPFDVLDLARGIEFILSEKIETKEMRLSARKKVAMEYLDLYEEILI